MAAAGWARRRSSRDDALGGGNREDALGGRNAGRVPVKGTRHVGGAALARALPVAVLSTVALALSLVLVVPVGMAGASTRTIRVSTAKVPGIGTVLTTASGLTLYRFTEDMPGTSTCTGACAKIWPPLLASKGAHVSGPHGLKGLSLMNVGNGHWQVAFHKVALYRFEGDKKKGQAHGQNVGHVWFAVLKSGIPASPAVAPAATSTTAPGAATTQPMTSTTQAQHAVTPAPTPAPTKTPATQTPVTQAPTPAPTTAPPPPPTTTPTTAPPPPTTTPTTSGGGGYGY
jgi:predicted lipoprotein with Yx(FWY)xxD motif